MQIDKITLEKIPDEFNSIIEVPMNDNAVKYELDKESGAIFLILYLVMEIQSMCWFYLTIWLY